MTKERKEWNEKMLDNLKEIKDEESLKIIAAVAKVLEMREKMDENKPTTAA